MLISIKSVDNKDFFCLDGCFDVLLKSLFIFTCVHSSSLNDVHIYQCFMVTLFLPRYMTPEKRKVNSVKLGGSLCQEPDNIFFF